MTKQGLSVLELSSVDGRKWRTTYSDPESTKREGLDDTVWPQAFERMEQFIQDTGLSQDDLDMNYDDIVEMYQSGKVNPSDDYFAPVRFVNNNADGTLRVTLTNNTFTGTIGTNGDVLLGDYRTGKESHALTATITTASPIMVKSSAGAAYSYAGGTITLD